MRIQYVQGQSAPFVVFNDSDLFLSNSPTVGATATDGSSQLLDLFESSWQSRQHLLRYQLTNVCRRFVSEELPLFADHIPHRFTTRRVHADVELLDAAFNPNGFHFGKADPDEISMYLWHEAWGSEPLSRVPVFINISPIDRHHYVLVPDCAQGLNQCLSHFALIVSLQLLLMTPGTSYRVGFNSLMAYASVNHLHCHLWLSEPVCLATGSPLEPLLPELKVFTLPADRMPVRGLVFELDALEGGDSLEAFSRRIHLAVVACQRLGVPHNLVAGKTHGGGRLRVCLFPRRPARFDPARDYCVAVAELSGQLILKELAALESLTPQTVLADYAACALTEDGFSEVVDAFKQLVAA